MIDRYALLALFATFPTLPAAAWDTVPSDMVLEIVSHKGRAGEQA